MDANNTGEQTSYTLFSGDKMPSVGLGCWKIPKEQCAEVTYNSIKAGYRLIDEAAAYDNEKECGQGIAKAIADGLITRKDLWVTSKLWNTYHRKEYVRAACKRTLDDMGLEYLDLYLIHFPVNLKFVPFEKRYPPDWFYDPDAENPVMEYDEGVPMSETWKAMEALVDEGLVKNIGVCNMGCLIIRDIFTYAKHKPSVLQLELHPYNTQQRLVRFCKEQGMAITAFSNLGAAAYWELNMAEKSDSIMEQQAVKDIAAKYQKTTAQVLLRWAVQRGTAAIPKTIKPERLAENIDIFNFSMTDDEMKSIDALDKNKRYNDPGHFGEAAFNTFFPIWE